MNLEFTFLFDSRMIPCLALLNIYLVSVKRYSKELLISITTIVKVDRRLLISKHNNYKIRQIHFVTHRQWRYTRKQNRR